MAGNIKSIETAKKRGSIKVAESMTVDSRQGSKPRRTKKDRQKAARSAKDQRLSMSANGSGVHDFNPTEKQLMQHLQRVLRENESLKSQLTYMSESFVPIERQSAKEVIFDESQAEARNTLHMNESIFTSPPINNLDDEPEKSHASKPNSKSALDHLTAISPYRHNSASTAAFTGAKFTAKPEKAQTVPKPEISNFSPANQTKQTK